MVARRGLGVLLCLTLFGRSSAGQEAGFVEVPFTVTTVSGQSLYIDLGRADQIQVGDVVRISSIGVLGLEGTVRNVSRTSARIVFAGGLTIEPGNHGVVLVPEERLEVKSVSTAPATLPEAGTSPEAPQKRPALPPALPPAWATPPVGWEGNHPLLSSAGGVDADARPRDISGSYFLDMSVTLDGDRTYASGATGVDYRMENPLLRGGVLRADLEYFTRTANLEESFDVDEHVLRIQRLYYSKGSGRGDLHGYTVGRFLPTDLPELGLLDGGEYIYQYTPEHRLGTSVGYLTGNRDELEPGEDFQVATFYRFDGDVGGPLSGRAGFQKSFHEGRSDRDLLVGGISYRPGGGLSLNCSVWIDHYGSEDDLKSSGFELTRSSLSGGYAGGGHGLIGRLSSTRYPQLLRDDLAGIPDDQISNERIGRVSVNGWVKAAEGVRLSVSTETWEDRNASGSGYELGFTLRDLLFDDGSIGASLFAHDLELGEDAGIRLSFSKRQGLASWRAFYDLRSYDFETESGENDGSIQHQLRISYDRPIGERWSLATFGSGITRDGDVSYSLGITLRWDL